MPAAAGAVAAAAGFDHAAGVVAGGAGEHCCKDSVLWSELRFNLDDVLRSLAENRRVIYVDVRHQQAGLNAELMQSVSDLLLQSGPCLLGFLD